jgi:hypothetical protein
LILGFTPHTGNAVLPLRDYESHAIGPLPMLPAGKDLILVVGLRED